MRAADRVEVSRVLANVGKALAAFQRGLRVQPTALDRYASGETQALTPEEKDGLAAFFVAGCAQCHYGPRLSDDAFHTLRFPTGRDDGTADRGRLDGLARLRDDEFSRAGLPPASRYAVGETEPWAQRFDPALTARIVRFLQVLRADIVTP